ncbi:MAG: hypothetical protein HUU08_05045, partial [Candidatus Brocadia sp.]|nr:hypothetical protein [Candidatus Brocadia sp.]
MKFLNIINVGAKHFAQLGECIYAGCSKCFAPTIGGKHRYYWEGVHSRFFVNLVNLVGWASPTKHLVHVAYFLVGD